MQKEFSERIVFIWDSEFWNYLNKLAHERKYSKRSPLEDVGT